MNLIKVALEQQVADFIRSLPPEPRRAVRRGIKNLAREKGDIRALEGEPVWTRLCRLDRKEVDEILRRWFG
jgi:hypothetical protein